MTKPSALSILSFDIDLNRIHAWSSESGRVCYNASGSEVPFQQMALHDITLIEVASNVFYDRTPSIVHRRAAWAIFNTYFATVLWTWHRSVAPEKKILVAPSSAWTLGYSEEFRHSIAEVTGDNHDIREVRCMQFFYRRNPDKWVPFETYFNSFSFKASPAKPKASKAPRAKTPQRKTT
jgi:hypothetical protein